MKKITLSLLLALTCIRTGFGQGTVTIEAPHSDVNYYNILQNGSAEHATFVAVFLYNATELAGLTGSVIPSVGLELSRGIQPNGAGVNGNFTLSLENTSDTQYNKGTSFTAAVQGMTTCYNGTINLPGVSGANTVNINFPVPANYTGGGLYVAMRWESAGPFGGGTVNNYAVYKSNTGTSTVPMGAIGDASLSTTFNDNINVTSNRACMVFRAVNTATNELGISRFEVPGKIAKLFNTGHSITAEIKNFSTVTKNNVVVSLNIGGANSFSDTQTIPAIAPGQSQPVTFASFNPTVSGVNDATLSIPSDINPTNNEAVRSQSVTCNIYAFNPATPIKINGIGNSVNSACMLTKITPATNATLTQVRLAIASSSTSNGGQICGVLMDATGSIMAMTNTVTINAGMLGTFKNFTFNPTASATTTVDLVAGTDYYVGMAMVTTAFFPMGCIEPPVYGYQPAGYYIASGNTGGVPSPVTPAYGYFGIEPVYGFAETMIDLSTSADIICKGDAVTLTTVGSASGYTWSASAGPGTAGMASVAVTPTTAITNTTTNSVNLTYTVMGKDAASGCLTNVATKIVTMTICSGIMNEEASAKISMYPNPSVNGKTVVRGLDHASTVSVLNLIGQVVSTQASKNGEAEIDLEALPAGNYFVKIADANNQVKVMKLINTH